MIEQKKRPAVSEGKVKTEKTSTNPTWKMLAKDVFRAGCLINGD